MDILKKIGVLFKTCINKSFHFVIRTCIQPRSISEDMMRRELILNSILFSLILLSFLLEFSLIHNVISLNERDYTGISPSAFAFISSLFVFLLILSRKGFFKLSTYILIIVFFISTTACEIYWGISVPTGLLGYSFIIIMSSILMDKRFTVRISLLIVILILILSYQESVDGYVPEWKNIPVNFGNGVQYSMFLFGTTLLASLSANEIEKSLTRARYSEQSLREERDQLEIRVQEKTRELRAAQAEKMSRLYRFAEFGKLSSGIFHDLLNPLSAIALNIESINNNLHPEIKEVKEHLSIAIKASNRMNDFIIAVRKQLKTDKFKEIFSINQIIEETMLLFKYKAYKEGICLEFNASEQLMFYGNPIKFYQIITNFVSNCLDSYQEIADSREKVVRISLVLENCYVKVSITDNGKGICKQVIPQIFEPFFTTKTYSKGIGLGLATTKEIVEKEFKGEVSLITEVDRGTTFTIIIPHILNEKSSVTE